MTGEQAPSGDVAPATVPAVVPAPAPEIRVSHADRDQVVEILREAAADGRLTADELDTRVEAALTARVGSELAVLTTDLPAPAGGPEPKDLVRIDQRFGDVQRSGRWVVPRRMEIRARAGNVKLDFTEAVISYGRLHIELDLGFGSDLVLIVRPGIEVLADDLTMRLGDVKVRRPKDAPDVPVVLRVELTGRVSGADVVVRPPRRTPGQWIRWESAR